MSERDDRADADPTGPDASGAHSPAPGEEVDADEFVVRALERAQRVARNHGYIRSTLPSWGLDETRPRRSLDGSSEYAAIETDGLGRLAGDDDAQARAAARAAAYGRLNGVSAPASSAQEDPEGDLAALRKALEGTGASWSRSPGMAAMRPRYRRANSLGAILERTISARAWDTPTKMGSVMAKWRDIVGPSNADHTRIETFEGHKLVVRADSTAWAKQLQLLLPTIERRIAEEVGSGVVEQVIILGPVAPSWKKGPYVVRGRGPRADYGEPDSGAFRDADARRFIGQILLVCGVCPARVQGRDEEQ